MINRKKILVGTIILLFLTSSNVFAQKKGDNAKTDFHKTHQEHSRQSKDSSKQKHNFPRQGQFFSPVQYVEIDSIKNATIVKLHSIEDFETMMWKTNSRTVFRNPKTNEIFLKDFSVFYSFSLGKYKTIADYKMNSPKKDNESRMPRIFFAKDLKDTCSEVYWGDKGKSFHTYEDCKFLEYAENHSKGTIEDSEKAGHFILCKACQHKMDEEGKLPKVSETGSEESTKTAEGEADKN